MKKAITEFTKYILPKPSQVEEQKSQDLVAAEKTHTFLNECLTTINKIQEASATATAAIEEVLTSPAASGEEIVAAPAAVSVSPRALQTEGVTGELVVSVRIPEEPKSIESKVISDQEKGQIITNLQNLIKPKEERKIDFELYTSNESFTVRVNEISSNFEEKLANESVNKEDTDKKIKTETFKLKINKIEIEYNKISDGINTFFNPSKRDKSELLILKINNTDVGNPLCIIEYNGKITEASGSIARIIDTNNCQRVEGLIFQKQAETTLENFISKHSMQEDLPGQRSIIGRLGHPFKFFPIKSQNTGNRTVVMSFTMKREMSSHSK